MRTFNQLLAVGLTAALLLAPGCGARQPNEPPKPEEQLAVASIRLAAMVGCDYLGQKEPGVAPQVQAGLNAAEALMSENTDYTQVVAAINFAVKDARQAAYITEAVRLVDAYVKSKTGVLTDANTVGYEAADAVIEGCRSGLAIHVAGV